MERSKMPMCKCGCGNPVTKRKNLFIYGHNLKCISPESEIKRRDKIKVFQKEFQNAPAQKEFKQLIWEGRHHTEETKKLLSKLRTGKGNGMFGNHHTEETKKKIIETKRKNGTLVHSKESYEKAANKRRGRKETPEQIKRKSERLKEYYKTHENAWKGKHHTKESKEKMSRALLGKYRGEKASNWQGGIDSLPYAIEWTPHFIESIKKRDKHKCQNPKCMDPHKLLDVHHIDYNKQNNDLSNLITLCKRCHGKTQKHRRYWVYYYQKVMEETHAKQQNTLKLM